MIDAIAYFTNAISVPSGNLEGIPYFTNGLCIPTTGLVPIDSKGGIHWMREKRQKFVTNARIEAEDISVIVTTMTIIENERIDE